MRLVLLSACAFILLGCDNEPRCLLRHATHPCMEAVGWARQQDCTGRAGPGDHCGLQYLDAIDMSGILKPLPARGEDWPSEDFEACAAIIDDNAGECAMEYDPRETDRSELEWCTWQGYSESFCQRVIERAGG